MCTFIEVGFIGGDRHIELAPAECQQGGIGNESHFDIVRATCAPKRYVGENSTVGTADFVLW